MKKFISRLSHLVWPIKKEEMRKFVSMSLLMFFILFSQNIVRSLKDSLVVTKMGAEVINFIKVFGEMPFGILFVLFYSKLCNITTTEKAFRIIVFGFVSFFTIFVFVIYPNTHFFHPSDELVNYYISNYPHAKWPIIMLSKWSYVLIYIMGELWPVIVFSLLFWQLANKITKPEDATRFYSYYCLFGQSNLLISGSVIVYFSSHKHFLLPLFGHLTDQTEITLKSCMTLVIFSCAMILYLHRYVEKLVDKENIKNNIVVKKTLTLSVKDSMIMVLKSPYLIKISLLIICYGTAINLIEGLWMSKIGELYKTTDAFARYQGRVLFWLGVVALGLAFFGSILIRKLGWYATAIISPCCTLFAGGAFFALVNSEQYLNDAFIAVGLFSPLVAITFFGGLQNVISKGAKYSLFDATKEMAYIPLSDEEKTKGKAAVDVVGTKIGKSTGASFQILLFTLFPNSKYQDFALYLMAAFVTICLVWLYSVYSLSKDYNNLISSKKIDDDEEEVDAIKAI
jgi:AAA family ATP:ADP antiporter